MSRVDTSHLFIITACSSPKKTITSYTSEDMIIFGRVMNVHEGEAQEVNLVYRTSDKDQFGGNPRAENQGNYYFTAIINRNADKFAVREIRMLRGKEEFSWGNKMKAPLAEVLIDPEARITYIGDIIMRTRNLPQGEEVTDFKIMDRSTEAQLFAIQKLKTKFPITKRLLKLTVK
jgi:hypothetical protein